MNGARCSVWISLEVAETQLLEGRIQKIALIDTIHRDNLPEVFDDSEQMFAIASWMERDAKRRFAVVPVFARIYVWKIVACVSAILILAKPEARAYPIEPFAASLEVECDGESTCVGVSRSEETLGRYMGVLVSRRGGGGAKIEVSAGDGVRYEAHGDEFSSVMFSWDGDQHPDRLSGAGLNCFDLLRNSAYSLVISDVRVESECRDGSQEGECPAVQIEARVYDAQDPTGQRFSSSVMQRTLVDGGDLIIPFSNFVREGPRGKANFSCVGAITLQLIFDSFESVDMAFGPIYTNGSEGLTPLPTITPEPSPTPSQTPTAEPSPTIPPLTPGDGDLEPSTVGRKEATPLMNGSVVAVPPTPVSSSVIETPGVPPQVVPAIPAGQEEEIIYGEVVQSR